MSKWAATAILSFMLCLVSYGYFLFHVWGSTMLPSMLALILTLFFFLLTLYASRRYIKE